MATIQLEDGIKIPLSKKMYLYLIPACVGPCSIGVIDIYRAYNGASHPMLGLVLGWITIAFFGGFPIILLWTVFFHKGSGFYINSKGINVVTPFVKRFLSWDKISGFSARQKLIVVRLKDLDDYLSAKNFIMRRLDKINTAMQGSPYVINTITYQCSPDELMAILQSNFEKYKS